jgi:hypothetical protein
VVVRKDGVVVRRASWWWCVWWWCVVDWWWLMMREIRKWQGRRRGGIYLCVGKNVSKCTFL